MCIFGPLSACDDVPIMNTHLSLSSFVTHCSILLLSNNRNFSCADLHPQNERCLKSSSALSCLAQFCLLRSLSQTYAYMNYFLFIGWIFVVMVGLYLVSYGGSTKHLKYSIAVVNLGLAVHPVDGWYVLGHLYDATVNEIHWPRQRQPSVAPGFGSDASLQALFSVDGSRHGHSAWSATARACAQQGSMCCFVAANYFCGRQFSAVCVTVTLLLVCTRRDLLPSHITKSSLPAAGFEVLLSPEHSQ